MDQKPVGTDLCKPEYETVFQSSGYHSIIQRKGVYKEYTCRNEKQVYANHCA